MGGVARGVLCPVMSKTHYGTLSMPEKVHVFPLFGREHEMTADCWCRPDEDEECADVIVHHPEQ